jgi:uncharacterized protein YeaO (DUF488 family)
MNGAREPRRSRSFEVSGAGKATLLFGAHDVEQNSAVALADYFAAN